MESGADLLPLLVLLRQTHACLLFTLFTPCWSCIKSPLGQEGGKKRSKVKRRGVIEKWDNLKLKHQEDRNMIRDQTQAEYKKPRDKEASNVKRWNEKWEQAQLNMSVRISWEVAVCLCLSLGWIRDGRRRQKLHHTLPAHLSARTCPALITAALRETSGFPPSICR